MIAATLITEASLWTNLKECITSWTPHKIGLARLLRQRSRWSYLTRPIRDQCASIVELTNFLSFFGLFKYLIDIYLIAFAELLLELILVLLLFFQYFGQEIWSSFLLLCVFLCSICKLIYRWRATSKKCLIFLDPILTLLKSQFLSHLLNLILFRFHLLFLVN